MVPRVQITKHAQDKMDLLGIYLDQVLECLQKGAKTRQTDGYLVSYTYIKLACKVKADGTWKIKTVYVE